MTAPPTDGDPAFADLLDELLDLLLNGDEPDLAAIATKHPTVRERVDEAYRLASGVAGRRETRRPVLAGYEVLGELGRGGMGTVYLARQEQLDREIALKVLPHSFGLSTASRRRFLDEARALAKVHHEHIVRIHRIVDDGEMLAFEMEYIDGPSLQTVLTHLREVRETTGEAPVLQHVADLLQLPAKALGSQNLTQFFVHIALRIARALGTVHAAGFVHRDVKPANILLRKNGQPVLADFGLVRDTSLERSHKTGFAGTPVYSSPEQLRGNAPVGPQTDVYALAVTLYECLTMSPPFAGRTTTDLLSRIESGRVPPLRQKAPQAPRDLETIVGHAMELSPESRYESGAAFADDLQRLLDLQPIVARPVGMVRRLGKLARRNRMTLVAGCLGALLVAAAMWPILDHVQAAGRAVESSRQHVLAARQYLLSPPCRRLAFGSSVFGGSASSDATSTADALAAIDHAIDHYERAVALRAEDEEARLELAVARMARWQRHLTVLRPDSLTEAMATPEFATIARDLPPLVLEAALASAADRGKSFPLESVLRRSTPAERKGIGLLAYLIGELRWAELAWANSPMRGEGQLVRDVVLGLLYLADGAPELAYVHLQAAQRQLPGDALALELADAALAMGEKSLAEQFLASAVEDPSTVDVMLRVRGDLEVLAGNDGAAASIYSELAHRYPLDPLPVYRLTQLAARAGELQRAERGLDALLSQWPKVTRMRLDRARIALQQRDVPAYLHQVLDALMTDLSKQSSGTCADLLEVLRIGGLTHLHHDQSQKAPGTRRGRAFLGGEMPIRTMVPAAIADRVEALLPALVELIRRADSVQLRGRRMDGLAEFLLVIAPLAASRLPAIASLLSLRQRLACEALPWLAWTVYPYLSHYARTLTAQLSLSSWRVMSLQRVEPPTDLANEHTFGSAVVRGADWNGDGIDEMLVGCETSDPGAAAGRVLIVDGHTAAVLHQIIGPPSPHLFGHSLAIVGDIDDDGVADWLVGAPSGSTDTGYGYAELRSGRDQTVIGRVQEQAAAFGVDVAGLGDIDGDGCPDFAVAVPPIVRNAAGQGHVALFSGRTRKVLRVLTNDLSGYWFGGSIANAGDTDRDGVRDLVVGGNFGDAPGLVRLYSGKTGAVLQAWRDDSVTSGFGCYVTGPGDLDGDGCGDITISAIRADAKNGVDQVHVLSGRTGKTLLSLHGSKPGILFGATVAPFSIANERRPSLAIGMPLGGGAASGSVEIWSLDGSPRSSVLGPGSHSWFGGLIATTNDQDGDGKPELFIAGPRPNHEGTISLIRSSDMRFARYR